MLIAERINSCRFKAMIVAQGNKKKSQIFRLLLLIVDRIKYLLNLTDNIS